MKKILFLLMFPVFICGQSLQFTKWYVQNSSMGNQTVLFKNDTMSIKLDTGTFFQPICTYQDSSNFISIVDLPALFACYNDGLYNYQILNDTLIFNVINDTCGGANIRVSFFTNSTWTSLNTGIQDEYRLFSLKTYPNPTQENFIISVNNFNGNIQSEVYDLIGNRLQTSNETTISLIDFAKGIYIIKVTYGDIVEEVKVIKE